MVMIAGLGLAGLYMAMKFGLLDPSTLPFKIFERKKKAAQEETGERSLTSKEEPPMTLVAPGFSDTSPAPVKQFWSKAHEILGQNLDQEQSVFKFVKETEEEAKLKNKVSPIRNQKKPVPENTEDSFEVEAKIGSNRRRIGRQQDMKDKQRDLPNIFPRYN